MSRSSFLQVYLNDLSLLLFGLRCNPTTTLALIPLLGHHLLRRLPYPRLWALSTPSLPRSPPVQVFPIRLSSARCALVLAQTKTALGPAPVVPVVCPPATEVAAAATATPFLGSRRLRRRRRRRTPPPRRRPRVSRCQQTQIVLEPLQMAMKPSLAARVSRSLAEGDVLADRSG